MRAVAKILLTGTGGGDAKVGDDASDGAKRADDEARDEDSAADAQQKKKSGRPKEACCFRWASLACLTAE